MQDTIESIFKSTKSIAVVGLSPDSSKASYRVGKFLQEEGFKIFPIYPKEDEILNEKVFRSLSEIQEKIDLVLMFRKGEVAGELLSTVVDKSINNFWLQLEIFNDEVKEKCKNLGINFVQNKCIMIEYQKWQDNAKAE